jgi:lipopolysaccharide biosynthesis regulator YciM
MDLGTLSNEIYQRNGTTAAPVQHQPTPCLFEPYPGLAKTVSVRSLQIPDKAQNEFQKACTALQAHKLQETEQHLRKALQIYPADASGWVMLGKVLEMDGRIEEAGEACSQGATHDPSYWAADICLAEIDGREQKWAISLAESNLAMSLNPESKRFADYFSAVALLNLNHVAEAETRALEAAQLDRDHQLPPLQLLIARIDEAKGDDPDAMMQLRDFLKSAKESPEADSAKEELTRLESEAK